MKKQLDRSFIGRKYDPVIFNELRKELNYLLKQQVKLIHYIMT